MIVNYTEQGWEVISQRAHGLLSAAIAEAWHDDVRGRRWIETLIATAEHDDAQTELESGNLLTERGGPVNFAMRKMELAHCEATMRLAVNKSTYIALLCARHLEFLCAGDGAAGPEVKAFMKAQAAQRAARLKTAGMKAGELEKDYALLQWCDALSLLLCRGMMQPEGRAMEISKGPDKLSYSLLAGKDGTLCVSPWPFREPAVTLSCEARRILQLTFADSRSFKEAYLNAGPFNKTWVFKK
ncbi:DUF3891 family protein [Mucilaginibacter conchicola]|uniref:DUF3891 family protein n=1 Tax=Mucilaginibacter conchicola TaxID=2303333 RepID=A0A372NSB9_9SPHI|nr:DUF3891 family protein [Mucilaginibacter conchicola]RFZ91245.1 DUF3891 family protein [Mucilaginibacter conchicola]